MWKDHHPELQTINTLKEGTIWLPQVCTSCKAHYTFFNSVIVLSQLQKLSTRFKETVGMGVREAKSNKNFFKKDK